MQEELNQFIASDVRELVPQPRNMSIIGTKWVFKNRLDENGFVSRNKARLVAQGYNQQEGIDYDETYALVARLESIRILLAYDWALDFKLFQMDVKSAFLNDFINEEIRTKERLSEVLGAIAVKKMMRRKFDNEVQFGEFCNANGITHNLSAPRTPQSNGVVERKNMKLQEMSRTTLNEQSLPQKFRCNTVDTSTYILNRILIRAILGKTPYEFLRGYSQNSKDYIILNKNTRKVKESLNVTFDETPPPSMTSPLVDDDLDEEEEIKVTEKKNLENDIVDETLEIDKIVNIKESRNHPLENVKGNLN
nr:copia protein [Tanacetum cinerariifolium]